MMRSINLEGYGSSSGATRSATQVRVSNWRSCCRCWSSSCADVADAPLGRVTEAIMSDIASAILGFWT